MNKMPEVYDDIEVFKAQLEQTDKSILYCTPEVASWYVEEDYEPILKIGQAVKVTKWENELIIVPVKWQVDENTQQWDWIELEKPFLNKNLQQMK
ncbi:hypothetical protein GF337_15455 [candidate division KSB1 bacterium]|nr:hypothetical protein [candidate division KSB1 bacterium]